MKSWVKEKLKHIADLYPQERLEKSKARYTAIWQGKLPQDRYPFVFSPAGFDYYNDVMTKEDNLRAYLDEFILRGFVPDDFIPGFFPGCKPSTIPSMFGAPEIVIGGDYTCEKILHKPEDIDNLPFPSIRPGTPAAQWLEYEQYFLEECEGEIPIHVCDMQGPTDVSAQIFGYDNLFLCAYDDPKRFHKLMTLATEAFYMLWDAQAKLLGEHFIGTHLYGWSWVPKGAPVSLSADVMAMLSAEFFDMYCAPYLAEIAARYGGVCVHSCGDFGAVMPGLCAIPGVAAVNAGQMSVKGMLDAGFKRDKVIVLSDMIDNANATLELAKRHNLLMDITLWGAWPQDIEGSRKAIIKKANQVAEAARF